MLAAVAPANMMMSVGGGNGNKNIQTEAERRRNDAVSLLKSLSGVNILQKDWKLFRNLKNLKFSIVQGSFFSKPLDNLNYLNHKWPKILTKT